jgi:hypothetical protein
MITKKNTSDYQQPPGLPVEIHNNKEEKKQNRNSA